VQSLYELSVEASVSAWEMLLPENSLSLAEKLRTSGLLGAASRVNGDE
jgi:hypothetical protein